MSLAARQVATGLLLASALSCTQPPPRTLVVHAGRLVDGTGSAARHDVTIVATDGTITAVDPGSPPPTLRGADTAFVDASELTVLPGLVNAHTQLFRGHGPANPDGPLGLGQALAAAHGYLRAGVTTLVDIGSPTTRALALRRYIGTARQRGPRLLVSGAALTRQAPRASPGRPAASLVAAAVGAARASCRQLVDRGVDFVAIADASSEELGGLSTVQGVAEPMDRRRRVLCAVVQEAHRQERRVVALVDSGAVLARTAGCEPDALLLAASARLNDDMLGLVAAGGRPTAIGAHPLQAAALRDAGAALALGIGPTDALPADAVVAALENLVAAGLTPEQAVAAASSEAARGVGLHEAIGRVAVGYRADLITIAGRPDLRIEDVRHVRHVLIDGVLQRRDGPRWYARLLAFAYQLVTTGSD